MATVWCNLDLPSEALSELEKGVQGHRLVVGKEPPADAEFAFGQPEVSDVLELKGLRLLQVATAGYTRYDNDEFRQGFGAKGAAMCNSSSVYDEPCAQHLLAMMLAFARQLPQALTEQLDSRAWSAGTIRANSWLLENQKVLLVGYGAIARRVVELLKPFGLEIVAVRRMPTGEEAVPTFRIEELDRLLPEADHVANILPANASTDGLFDASKFNAMKSGAYFYNIGRGTTVDQSALIQALETAHLKAAYLDVTDPEPLPKDHPLWSSPNCFITPHTAGGHRGEEKRLVRLFLHNFRASQSRGELKDRVF